MGCLDLFPRIPACAHRCLFFSGYLCIFTELFMCGGKNWTKGSYSWRGLARTEREPWLSKWHDAMRCDAKINEARIQQIEPQLNVSFLLSAHGRSFTIRWMDGSARSRSERERPFFSDRDIERNPNYAKLTERIRGGWIRRDGLKLYYF